MLLDAIRNRVSPNIMFQINDHYAELMVCKLAPIDSFVLNDEIFLM